MPLHIGVLAIQGGFHKHVEMLESLGVDAFEVRTQEEIERCDGLIIPGGESTTIAKLLISFSLAQPIIERVKQGMPVFGTCAGMILLSSKIEGYKNQYSFGLMHTTVERNAYGRQIESFETTIPFQDHMVEAVFIRAPRIQQLGKDAEVLMEYEGDPVCIREGHMLAASFHPELSGDTTLHRYFIEMVEKAIK
jgi:5'-phosphate synthase pdxT subunit